MSDAVMVPRERLIEIIGGEVCVMADHGDSIDPSSVEDAADAILKAFAASTPVGGWEDISTHDGSREPVLLWFPDFAPQGVVIGFYKAPEPDCYYPGQWVDDLTNEPFEVDKGEVFPSLWMPLPPPPSVSIDNGPRPQEAVPTEQAGRAVVALTQKTARALPAGTALEVIDADSFLRHQGFPNGSRVTLRKFDGEFIDIGEIPASQGTRPFRFAVAPTPPVKTGEG